MTLTQSVRWMDIPRPLVTKPTISSPGTGEQHLENLTDTSSIPLTIIPFLLPLESLALPVLPCALSSTSLSVTSSRCFFSYSSRSLFTTCPSLRPPCPTAARMESQSLKPYFIIVLSINSCLRSSARLIFLPLQYVEIRSLPFTILSSLSSALNHELILERACGLLTIESQSRLGPLEFCDVIISILSPFLIL